MSRLGPRYVTVEDVRAEGVDPTLTDAFIADRIAYASRIVETWTGRWFYARPGSHRIDGTGQGIVTIPDPIVSIQQVSVVCGSGTIVPVDASCYVVYNRHLSQGFPSSGDRDQPALQFVTDQVYGNRYPVGGFVAYSYDDRTGWPHGAQTVLVAGRFGFTDPAQACVTSVTGPFALTDLDTLEIRIDGAAGVVVQFDAVDFADIGAATVDEVADVIEAAGVPGVVIDTLDNTLILASETLGTSSTIEVIETTATPGSVFGFATGVISNPDGVTPAALQRAVLLLVIRDLVLLGERDDRWLENNRHRLTEMRTRDQTVRFSGTATRGLEHQTTGMWSGDPEIDNILSTYCRPPSVEFVGGVDPGLSPRPGTLGHLGRYRGVGRLW